MNLMQQIWCEADGDKVLNKEIHLLVSQAHLENCLLVLCDTLSKSSAQVDLFNDTGVILKIFLLVKIEYRT